MKFPMASRRVPAVPACPKCGAKGRMLEVTKTRCSFGREAEAKTQYVRRPEFGAPPERTGGGFVAMFSTASHLPSFTPQPSGGVPTKPAKVRTSSARRSIVPDILF
jgi:hypothetical protein